MSTVAVSCWTCGSGRPPSSEKSGGSWMSEWWCSCACVYARACCEPLRNAVSCLACMHWWLLLQVVDEFLDHCWHPHCPPPSLLPLSCLRCIHLCSTRSNTYLHVSTRHHASGWAHDCRYFTAYLHVSDTLERRALVQTILNLHYRRPRFDLEAAYFVPSYGHSDILSHAIYLLPLAPSHSIHLVQFAQRSTTAGLSHLHQPCSSPE